MRLEPQQLEEVRQTLRRRIEEGLARGGTEIAAIPTYLPMPKGPTGKALVMDTGGTNMRASVVELEGASSRIIDGPIASKIPDGRSGPQLSAQQFFEQQAELFTQLEAASGKLPLGYCFSYPAEVLPDRDARLTHWTKGIDIPEVVGMKVGSSLAQALAARGLETKSATVLNDTVASLLGGAVLEGDPRFGIRYIGLIVGTGTNMAGVFAPSQLKKLEGVEKAMVVNLESGNYHPPHLTDADDRYDATTGNPGRQRFEKAVSGYYLPFVYDTVRPGVIDPTEGSAQLVEMRDRGDQLAGQLLERSAQLVAAGLAAVCDLYDEGPVAVLGEGSLLWGDPLYADKLTQTLESLAGPGRAELVHQRENVNLFGAAAAALTQR